MKEQDPVLQEKVGQLQNAEVDEEGRFKITYYDAYGNELPAEYLDSVGEAKARGRMNGAIAFHAGTLHETARACHIRLFPDGHFQRVEEPGLMAFMSRKAQGHQRRQQQQIRRMMLDPAYDRGGEENAQEGDEDTATVGRGEGEERPGT